MIQELANGIITLMLAKFVLNDVPHAFGIGGSSTFPWVSEAWYRLNTYAVSHGIKFFSPDEAYKSMIEHRMPADDITGRPVHEAVLGYMSLYRRYLEEGPLPNWTVPTRVELENLRAYMAGYHIIAIGEASDQIVDDVYHLVKDRFLKFAAAYENGKEITEFEIQTGTDQWYKDLKTAVSLFVNGTRASKVIAIDAVAHLLHEYEPRTTVEDIFVEGPRASFEFTPIWFALGQMFDIWFGIDPRRGISFAEFMEG